MRWEREIRVSLEQLVHDAKERSLVPLSIHNQVGIVGPFGSRPELMIVLGRFLEYLHVHSEAGAFHGTFKSP